MADEKQKDGSPEPATHSVAEAENAEEAATEAKSSIQALRETVCELESIARSLKARQRRSRLRIIN